MLRPDRDDEVNVFWQLARLAEQQLREEPRCAYELELLIDELEVMGDLTDWPELRLRYSTLRDRVEQASRVAAGVPERYAPSLQRT